MPILSSKVRDAKPQINAEAESEKQLFNIKVNRGFVEIRRGNTKGSLLRIRYAEVSELHDALHEIVELLETHGYDHKESLTDGYQAGDAKPAPENPTGPRTPAATPLESATPSESGVVSIATQGAPQPAVVQAEQLASKPTEQPAGEVSQDGTVAQPANDDNPFG